MWVHAALLVYLSLVCIHSIPQINELICAVDSITEDKIGQELHLAGKKCSVLFLKRYNNIVQLLRKFLQ